MTRELEGHAVVLGAGIAGLLAARVLSERYDTVTLVERDVLPDGPIQRRGIPQGQHLHGLLSRGSQLLGEFFPGLLDELADAGAQVIDDGDLSRVYTRTGDYGLDRTHALADPQALVTYQATRPMLEYHVRRRVAALPNVTVMDGHDVVAPTAPTSDRISGVLVVNRATGVSTVVAAELVVDAMGRAARTPAVLESLGYERPPELRSTAHGAYFSQFLKLPDAPFAERLILVQPGQGARIGGLIAYEDDTWALTVGGADDGSNGPTEFREMLACAAGFLPAHVHAALQDATPLGDVSTFRYHGGAWRRYDRAERLPAGLLVIGDALCTLNPSHGQGMTLAALQAVALREALDGDEAQLPQRFYRAAAAAIAPTWAMNQARLRSAPRPRSLAKLVQHWATSKALQAAEHDIVLTERLLRVTQLVDPPSRLSDPTLLPRVIAGSLSRQFGGAPWRATRRSRRQPSPAASWRPAPSQRLRPS